LTLNKDEPTGNICKKERDMKAKREGGEEARREK